MEEDKYAPLGGQAVLEGVLMRGKETLAVAVRKPSNKEIIIETTPVKKNAFSRLSKIPFVRGIVALVDSLIIGMRALNFSADIVIKDLEDAEKNNIKIDYEKMPEGESSVIVFSKETEKVKEEKKLSESIMSFGLMVFSFALAIGLFMVLPAGIFNYLKDKVDNVIFLNLIEGCVRITIFVLYIYFISRMEDVKRLFQYHGAEHKTIHAYEAKEELTVQNARKYSTLHPRCGTNFIFLTLITSILLFSLLGRTENIAVRVVSKLSLLPFVAGIAYELIRIAGQIKNKPDNILVKIAYFLSAPGILMQKLTTREPDDSQLEVAIVSLRAALNDKNFELKAFQESVAGEV